MEAYIKKCKEISHTSSIDLIQEDTLEDNEIGTSSEIEEKHKESQDETGRQTDEEDEKKSSMMNYIFSLLQGLAFQHYSNWDDNPNLFPIVLKAEY